MIELMVVVAMTVVLLGLTAPSLSGFITRNQVSSAQSSLISTLAFARSEAARRGATVFVVAAAGTVGNEYAGGWDVYADNDADGVFGAADAPSLRHYEALPSKVVLRGTVQVAFGADGYLAPAAARTFRVCQAAADSQGYLVTLPPSGIADIADLRLGSEAECTG